ncbi:MAG: transketolase family protein, partial [Nitrospinae bacterium]|nr:transketolase family protein [Nitrospinota bacterium]
GIAEQDLIGTAAGLAAAGKIAFASTFAIFATGRAWEIVRQSVCLPNANVKVVATHGGLTVGQDGATHQALEDVAIMRALPNMQVVVPADAHETAAVIKYAAETSGPFYIRLTREKFPIVCEETMTFELGKSTVLREGTSATVAACGLMVSYALEAAEILEKEGISLEVINASSIKPLDSNTIITSAKKTGKVITVEEHNHIGALGGAVAELLSEKHPTPVKRIGVEDSFGRTGKAPDVLDHFGLSVPKITAQIREFLK